MSTWVLEIHTIIIINAELLSAWNAWAFWSKILRFSVPKAYINILIKIFEIFSAKNSGALFDQKCWAFEYLKCLSFLFENVKFCGSEIPEIFDRTWLNFLSTRDSRVFSLKMLSFLLPGIHEPLIKTVEQMSPCNLRAFKL